MKKEKPIPLEHCIALMDLCKEAEQYGWAYFWINDKPFMLKRLYIMNKPN